MKRSRDMIIEQILSICIEGASKTHIVYQANLNFRTINPYLVLLINTGNLDLHKDQKLLTYGTTAKGLDLLNSFRTIHKELSLPSEEEVAATP